MNVASCMLFLILQRIGIMLLYTNITRVQIQNHTPVHFLDTSTNKARTVLKLAIVIEYQTSAAQVIYSSNFCKF